MKEFNNGKTLQTVSGKTLKILAKLGEGGQGVVYKALLGKKEFALKWYKPGAIKQPDAFYANIRNNIEKGSPSPVFLWPLELTERTEGSFGYLMDLRPDRFKELPQFLTRKVCFSGITAAIHAAMQIVSGFRALHGRGYSYQDLNDGNFFADPKNGDVLICDNDNVAPYGESLGVLGKCRYMAPEVVTGKKRPDVHTDRFSMAVILFLLFCMGHPLEGEGTLKFPCLTTEVEKKIYGSEPVFVFDRHAAYNRPHPEKHKNVPMLWRYYPPYIQDLFHSVFSKESMTGSDAEHRVNDMDWMKALSRFQDSLARCPHCGWEAFISEQQQGRCASCGKTFQRPLALKSKRSLLALVPGKKLFASFYIGSDGYDECVGEVIPSKNNPSLLGLRNLSGSEWKATLPSGAAKAFPPQSVIPLYRDIAIEFERSNAAQTI